MPKPVWFIGGRFVEMEAEELGGGDPMEELYADPSANFDDLSPLEYDEGYGGDPGYGGMAGFPRIPKNASEGQIIKIIEREDPALYEELFNTPTGLFSNSKSRSK